MAAGGMQKSGPRRFSTFSTNLLLLAFDRLRAGAVPAREVSAGCRWSEWGERLVVALDEAAVGAHGLREGDEVEITVRKRVEVDPARGDLYRYCRRQD